MGKTSIEWTDQSLPIANGCRFASPGCQNCYAARLSASRLKHLPQYKGLAQMHHGEPRWTGDVATVTPDIAKLLRMKKAQRFFVADMGDLFYKEFSDTEIDSVFGMFFACRVLDGPAHTFQVLTKRADRMREYLTAEPPLALLRRWATTVDRIQPDLLWKHAGRRGAFLNVFDALRDSAALFPLANVMLGVSAEDQEWAARRIVDLLQTPAAARFVSLEPLLGPIDLMMLRDGSWYDREGAHFYDAIRGTAYWSNGDHGLSGGPRLDWVIVGGESGPRARPLELAWLTDLVNQCGDINARHPRPVPLFVKQLGTVIPRDYDEAARAWVGIERGAKTFNHAKGGDMMMWPKHLRVRQLPKMTPWQSLVTDSSVVSK